MEYVKLLHVVCAILTGMSFFIRGVWMINGSALFAHKLTKVIPHIIDSLLLISAILLAYYYKLNPLYHDWLLAKIVLLLLYIGCGMCAFRFVKSKIFQILFWVLALILLFLIYFAALTKQGLFF